MGHTVRRCPQTGGQVGCAEAGLTGFAGTEYDDRNNGNWQSQDSWTDQGDQSAWDRQEAYKPLDEQGLSQKLADVGFEAETQAPEFGW